ncbi:stearoyl-CoA desaturase 5-like protein [Dinothrombium tinctorium]|uniref:Stearoyl-CoA desaturase 5-like protein n=1 Tax=Dinothrombium tinctorium TaxID=1965070 RepID=A0A443RRI5_9ACAR|nr:stearoyl-CoA desaturase 5-like protein [Dinothrombium tinctorium]
MSYTQIEENETKQFKAKILWPNVFIISTLHITALYGFYLFLFWAKWQTIGFTLVLYVLSGLGVTAGSHRLWSHRSYKAKLPLRILLAAFHTIACQRDIYEWSHDHRIHHKYSETDSDPHNVRRGFFFAHVGWLLLDRHPKVIEKKKLINCNDLLSDPVVYYQRKQVVS